MQNPYETYIKSSVQTASGAKQVALLYDRAILALKQAEEDIVRNDIASKAENIAKVTNIINALDASLDMEHGGEIARNLKELYAFVNASLFTVHAKNDTGLIDDLIDILMPLRSSWEKIASNA